MKRLLGFIALALVVGLLCGCSNLIESQTITEGELSITLPGTFLDLSEQAPVAGIEFLYGFGETAVLAIKEDKAMLLELVPGMDAMQYAQLFVESNALTGTVEEVDGIPSFTYTAASGGTQITYLCGVFESSTHFWVVQAYCDSQDFADNQQALWSYLASVTIA